MVEKNAEASFQAPSNIDSWVANPPEIHLSKHDYNIF